MPDRPEQLPEGALIQRAAERGRRSVRQLATLAGISEGRWRQIVNGYQSAGRGEQIPVTAPALTLARMAKVVGVDAEQLRKAGRDDAAAELEHLSSVDESATAERPSRRSAAEVAIRQVAVVMDVEGLTDTMRLDTIRGILYRYEQQLARMANQMDDDQERQMEVG